MSMNAISGLLIFVIVCCVSADYQLSLTIYSYDNPENKCADCRDSPQEPFGCCDNHLIKDAAACARSPRFCEVVLSACLIEQGMRVRLCPQNEALFSREQRPSPLDPPLSYTTMGTEWDNSQLLVVLEDDDFSDGFELIDRGVIQLTAGTRISRRNVTGQFELATVELELSLVCVNNFYGADCSRLCESPPCACDPGFTGEFCETDIDECASVDCSGRGVCSDGVNSYTCTCGEGYSGTNCEVSISAVAGGVTAVGVLILIVVVMVILVVTITFCKRRKHVTILDNKSETVGENNLYQNPGFLATKGVERDFNNPIYNLKDDIVT